MVQGLPTAHRTIAALFVLASLCVIGRTDDEEVDFNGGKVKKSLFEHKNWNLLPHQDCGMRKMPGVTTRIVNGETALLGEFPWMAKYYKNFADAQIPSCGGTIISENYILTATHCCNTYNETGVLPTIGAGSIRLIYDPNYETVFTVKKVITHKNYSKATAILENAYINDMCLVRLEKPIQFTDNIKPICLPIYKRFKEEEKNGTIMETAGWGSMVRGSKDQRHLAPLLQKLNTTVYENPRLYAGWGDKFITKHAYANAGAGDSGGPLMKLDPVTGRYYVFGVMTSGSHLPNIMWAFYIKIFRYLRWILNQLKP